MLKRATFLNQPVTNKIIFAASVSLFTYWYFGSHVNVYRSAFPGAFYELCWLPMLGLLIILPVISVFLMTREKLNIRSLSLYSFLFSLATIVMLILS